MPAAVVLEGTVPPREGQSCGLCLQPWCWKVPYRPEKDNPADYAFSRGVGRYRTAQRRTILRTMPSAVVLEGTVPPREGQSCGLCLQPWCWKVPYRPEKDNHADYAFSRGVGRYRTAQRRTILWTMPSAVVLEGTVPPREGQSCGLCLQPWCWKVLYRPEKDNPADYAFSRGVGRYRTAQRRTILRTMPSAVVLEGTVPPREGQSCGLCLQPWCWKVPYRPEKDNPADYAFSRGVGRYRTAQRRTILRTMPSAVVLEGTVPPREGQSCGLCLQPWCWKVPYRPEKDNPADYASSRGVGRYRTAQRRTILRTMPSAVVLEGTVPPREGQSCGLCLQPWCWKVLYRPEKDNPADYAFSHGVGRYRTAQRRTILRTMPAAMVLEGTVPPREGQSCGLCLQPWCWKVPYRPEKDNPADYACSRGVGRYRTTQRRTILRTMPSAVVLECTVPPREGQSCGLCLQPWCWKVSYRPEKDNPADYAFSCGVGRYRTAQRRTILRTMPAAVVLEGTVPPREGQSCGLCLQPWCWKVPYRPEKDNPADYACSRGVGRYRTAQRRTILRTMPSAVVLEGTVPPREGQSCGLCLQPWCWKVPYRPEKDNPADYACSRGVGRYRTAQRRTIMRTMPSAVVLEGTVPPREGQSCGLCLQPWCWNVPYRPEKDNPADYAFSRGVGRYRTAQRRTILRTMPAAVVLEGTVPPREGQSCGLCLQPWCWKVPYRPEKDNPADYAFSRGVGRYRTAQRRTILRTMPSAVVLEGTVPPREGQSCGLCLQPWCWKVPYRPEKDNPADYAFSRGVGRYRTAQRRTILRTMPSAVVLEGTVPPREGQSCGLCLQPWCWKVPYRPEKDNPADYAFSRGVGRYRTAQRRTILRTMPSAVVLEGTVPPREGQSCGLCLQPWCWKVPYRPEKDNPADYAFSRGVGRYRTAQRRTILRTMPSAVVLEGTVPPREGQSCELNVAPPSGDPTSTTQDSENGRGVS